MQGLSRRPVAAPRNSEPIALPVTPSLPSPERKERIAIAGGGGKATCRRARHVQTTEGASSGRRVVSPPRGRAYYNGEMAAHTSSYCLRFGAASNPPSPPRPGPHHTPTYARVPAAAGLAPRLALGRFGGSFGTLPRQVESKAWPLARRLPARRRRARAAASGGSGSLPRRLRLRRYVPRRRLVFALDLHFSMQPSFTAISARLG